MNARFPFKKVFSTILGKIKRPIAEVELFNKKLGFWVPYSMVVDTGADYSLIPKHLTQILNIDLKNDTKAVTTLGIGGQARVFLLKKHIKAKIDHLERSIILGVIDNIYTPPLLGRYAFLETFKVVLEKFTTTFS